MIKNNFVKLEQIKSVSIFNTQINFMNNLLLS